MPRGRFELAATDLGAGSIEEAHVRGPGPRTVLERDGEPQVHVGAREDGVLEAALHGLLERRTLDTRVRAFCSRHLEEHARRRRLGMSGPPGAKEAERESKGEACAPHEAKGSLSGRGKLSEVLRSFGLAAAVGLLAMPATVGAAEPVRVRYTAPDGCPNAADFLARVRGRSPTLVVAADGELARSFAVTIATEPAGTVGRLEFVDSNGENVSRVVRGETCDEVVSSVALVTALVLGAPATDPPPLEGVEPAPHAPPAASVSPAPPPPPAPKKERPVMGAGFGAGYIGWAGPSGGLGIDAFFDVIFHERGPTLRIGAWHWRATESSGGRSADFRAWGGRLERCPFVLPAGAFFAMPCLATNLGYFRGEGVEGTGVARPQSSGIFWADLLLLARVGVRLGTLVSLEAQGDLEFPLIRHTFGFRDPNGGPSVTVYEIPAVSGGAEGHLVVRFP